MNEISKWLLLKHIAEIHALDLGNKVYFDQACIIMKIHYPSAR